MFFEMFAASALAQVIFGNNSSSASRDYSSDFAHVKSELSKAHDKLDTIIDTQRFMRARMCLTEFSPKLLNNIELTYEHHSIQDIMQAAKEGFDELLAIACADDNNFLQARSIFNNTFGDEKWVNATYGEQIDKVEEAYIIFLQSKQKFELCKDEQLSTIKDEITNLIVNTPCRGHIFKKLDEEKCKEQIQNINNLLNTYTCGATNFTNTPEFDLERDMYRNILQHVKQHYQRRHTNIIEDICWRFVNFRKTYFQNGDKITYINEFGIIDGLRKLI